MSDYSLDVDREAVQLDDVWYTAEELAAKVTEMLGAKDFRIGTVASALEALQAALGEVKDIGFRLPGPMLETLEATAGKEGRTTSAILRDALQVYFESKGDSGSPPVLGKSEGSGPPAPAAANQSPQPLASPDGVGGDVTVESLSVSEEEAAAAVPLTPKKKENGDEESGWFGKK